MYWHGQQYVLSISNTECKQACQMFYNYCSVMAFFKLNKSTTLSYFFKTSPNITEAVMFISRSTVSVMGGQQAHDRSILHIKTNKQTKNNQ